jgi:hypothetical protein
MSTDRFASLVPCLRFDISVTQCSSVVTFSRS